jgi:hypothetical protein
MSARCVASAFLSAAVLLSAAARATAQPEKTLTVSAVVLTNCSVDAETWSCSRPVQVRRELSAVQTRRVAGQLRRFVVATLNF